MHFPLAALLSLATIVNSHGLVTKPATRTPGDATAAVCGKPLVTFYKQDNTSYPEALMRSRGWDAGMDKAKCNQYLCKGFQFADNTANVLKYKPGDTIDMEVKIRIPHVGNANVSVVDTTTNSVIGAPLINWASGYADGGKFPNLPKDQTSFSVKVPDLGGKCTAAGECVIQWYWFGQGQTYESCIDFTVPGAAVKERTWEA